jgi:hypothetical protein
MKYNSIYNNFSSGELSRYLKGRTDITEYAQGLEEMTNFIPMKQGGAYFRPGSESIGYIPNSIAKFVMVPFTPRDGESYIIALNPSNGGEQIVITRLGVGVCSVTKAAYIWNTRKDFWNASTAYDSGNTDHPERLYALNWVQSGDTVIVFDGTGKLAPIVIMRRAENTFIVDSMLGPALAPGLYQPLYLNSPFIPLRVPYKDPNLDPNIKLKVTGVTAGSTVTMTAEDGSANPVSLFKGDVVGLLVKLTHTASGTGIGFVTAKTSDSQVTVLVLVAFGGTTTSSNFEVSAWNPNDGYPRCGAFYEQRLVCGGSPAFPDTVWLSNTGNIYHFMQRRLLQDASSDTSGFGFFGTLKTTDPFSFIPASVSANSIQWLYPADTLLIGTTLNEYSVYGGTDNALSISTIFVKSISAHGSSRVQPVKVGSSILFVSHEGKRILEIPKKLADYVSAAELSSISEGIIEKSMKLNTTSFNKVESKIRRLAWQETEGILWLLCDDNTSLASSLISLTYDKTSKVIAWAKHYFAYSPRIYSICCLPDLEKGSIYRLYILMKRTGANYNALEVLSVKNLEDNLFISSANMGYANTSFMDATSSLINLAGNTVVSLPSTHTNSVPVGATYSVFAYITGNGDSVYLGDFVESGGNITVPVLSTYPDCNLTIGVPYTGQIKTMPTEAGAQFGVAQGSARRTHEITVFVDRSRGGQYKASKAVDFYPLVEASKMNTNSDLFTGECRLSLNASPDDHQVLIVQNKPLPLMILWLLTKGYTYDV